MKSLCKYRHIFGREGEGIHSIRLFGVAAIDLGMTIVACALISWYLKVNFLLVFVLVMLVAIVIHRVFCVNTALNTKIFGKV